MSMRYTVSDGRLVLNLEAAEEGGYVVTSPLDPELITQAETIEEAFANARDAAQALKQSRVKLLRGFRQPRQDEGCSHESPPTRTAFAPYGCVLHHHGGNHDVWVNLSNLAQAPVPRHSRIKRGTVRGICRILGIPRPRGT